MNVKKTDNTRNVRKRGRRRREDDSEERAAETERRVEQWVPKTAIGKKVKDGEIKSIQELFDRNYTVMEPEIFDVLVSGPLESLVDFKKTTRVTRQGSNFSFRATVIIGDGQEFIGIGTGKE